MSVAETVVAKEIDEPPDNLAISTDLLSDGTFGVTQLTIEGDRLLVVEDGKPKLDLLISEISDAAVESLVDSSALVVKRGDERMELVRGSNRYTTLLFSVQRRLEGMINGDETVEELALPRACPKCGRPLPEDSDVCDACVHRGKTLLRVISYLKPYKLQVLSAAGLILFVSAMDLVPPFLTKVLVDNVLPAKDLSLFYWLVSAMIGSRILMTGATMIRARLTAGIGHSAIFDLRSDLYSHLQALSMNYFDKRQVGSILSRITQDTGALLDMLVDAVPSLLGNTMLILGVTIALFTIRWEVALLVLVPAPFVALLMRAFRRKIFRAYRHFWHRWSRLAGALTGTLSGMRVVKAFAGEDLERKRFDRRVGELRDTGVRAERMWATLAPMIQFMISTGTFLVWFFAGPQIMGGKMTVGELFAFLGYLALFYAPLQQLTRWLDWTSRSLSAAERVFEILDTQPDIADGPEAVVMPDIQGHVQFENVNFGYDRLRVVLKNINLDVRAGEMIGLVGHSGAGKTTFINLLARFYDPLEGRILIDGVDARHVRLEDFRRSIAIVLQDAFLFPTTIRENIAYGRSGVTDEEIMNAAKAANAHDFIMKFPDGYDSYVGERGQRLSGGERQRISIARAILHNPRILILDEATSSVDSETEAAIQEALDRLIQGRTTFVIAHRLSTLRHSDRIIVLDDGAIVQVGTHDALMEEDGVYKRLVEKQREMSALRAL